MGGAGFLVATRCLLNPALSQAAKCFAEIISYAHVLIIFQGYSWRVITL